MKKVKNYNPNGTAGDGGRPNMYDGSDAEAIKMEDGKLIDRCRGGDLAAFGQLIEKYQDRLYNMVLRMVGNQDDALELTQEAFYRAIRGLKGFRKGSGFYTWLYRIGMNLCINHHRRRGRVTITSLQGGDDEGIGRQADGLAALMEDRGAGPSQQVQLKESHSRVLAAVEQLEPAARAVVVLRDIEQLNYAEIAEVLEVPVGTVKSRLARARNALREQLAEE